MSRIANTGLGIDSYRGAGQNSSYLNDTSALPTLLKSNSILQDKKVAKEETPQKGSQATSGPTLRK